MKAIIIACLLLPVFCQEMHYFHYHEGRMSVNSETPVRISGPIYIEFLKTMNVTTIAGLHINGTTKTPFAVAAKITKIYYDHHRIEIDAECWEAGWGTSMFRMSGHVKVVGNMQEIHYFSDCHNVERAAHWSIEADARATKCPFYTPEEAARRAPILLGQSGDLFHTVHVVNYAVVGYPYVNTIKDCAWYLNNLKNFTEPKPGFVIVGLDGRHCGIVDKEGDKFFHTCGIQRRVTAVPLSMVDAVFFNGYIFKDYGCQANLLTHQLYLNLVVYLQIFFLLVESCIEQGFRL
eukprot:TRINITY_DN121539_c0_g1_i1.p1 TRINITY_DN121539_c0_g1~~TRINITY_DN121539_c0_g1_i1.p1  ORF type:complete len:329 (-),score=-2.84 TRINITY_DN121539_c0_g1_i1:81-953(-)